MIRVSVPLDINWH